jgi:hypothetical protein
VYCIRRRRRGRSGSRCLRSRARLPRRQSDDPPSSFVAPLGGPLGVRIERAPP